MSRLHAVAEHLAGSHRAGAGRQRPAGLACEEHCARDCEDSEVSSCVENLNQKHRQEYTWKAVGERGVSLQ